MRKILLLLSLGFVAACNGSVQDNLGLRRAAPNEFRVIANPPLSVPPAFSLKPPASEGELAKKDGSARDVLFEQASADLAYNQLVETTNGDSAFASRFGAESANPNIKAILKKDAEEEAKREKEKSLLDKIPGFSSKEKKSAAVLDARAERDRIVNNKKNSVKE